MTISKDEIDSIFDTINQIVKQVNANFDAGEEDTKAIVCPVCGYNLDYWRTVGFVGVECLNPTCNFNFRT